MVDPYRMRYRRRPKMVWAQQSDIYTGLEKSDRESPSSDAISENMKRRKKRSDESDNPYRRLYAITSA
ncbi:Uncharacterized protein BM_BM128 [Brugia malayi]|uniref:Uncharacterized protein n=1 Tax=Brugia malayi TaxID=6279 RepID=A0A4E9FS14_BRUMA|nr:Uncharacterized protein BM_BM128 [Brugia malayi]VIP00084.1 Uncharacterized protein BM_BM128 [Brugia malayi]